MPVFRVPRASVEIEVAHLESKGHRVTCVVDDGPYLLVFTPPHPERGPVEQRPAALRGGREIAELPEWRSEVSA